MALSITYEYPRPALTVDVVIFTIRSKQLQVLLVERKFPPFQGMAALPGGFIELDESLEDAAMRELAEETGVNTAYLEQLYTYGNVNRDPRDRVISVAYFAIIPLNTQLQPDMNADVLRASWYPVNELPSLAFDHGDILEYALRRLRYKLEYTAVGFELLPPDFTLSELQTIYEIILGESLDKRNFRRRILSANIIEPTKHMKQGDGRPARLFRYKEDAVAEVTARRLFP